MTDTEYIRQYWRWMDDREEMLLQSIGKMGVGLSDEIQTVFDWYSRLEANGWLSRREVEGLHRRIAKWKEGCGESSYVLLLYMRDLENRSRIREEEALFLSLFAAMSLYHRDVMSEAEAVMTDVARHMYVREFDAAQSITGAGSPRPPTKEQIAQFFHAPLPDGTRYTRQLEDYAQYAASRLAGSVQQQKRQGNPLDAGRPEFSQIITAAQNRLLKPSASGGHHGYLDQVLTSVVGYTVMRVFKDSGVEKYLFIAVLDDVTTQACRFRHRKVYNVSDMKLGVNVPPICPPPHPCRSVVRALASGADQAAGAFRSAGVGDATEPHSYRLVGSIDRQDKEAVQSLIGAFEKQFVHSKTEHCLVITENGEVYIVDGDEDTVDTSLLGERMKGSVNTHNHPAAATQYSFSEEDMKSFLEDGSAIMRGFDGKYGYEVVRPDTMPSLERMAEELSYAKRNRMSLLNERGIPFKQVEFHETHVIMETACKKLGIPYRRWKRND